MFSYNAFFLPNIRRIHRDLLLQAQQRVCLFTLTKTLHNIGTASAGTAGKGSFRQTQDAPLTVAWHSKNKQLYHLLERSQRFCTKRNTPTESISNTGNTCLDEKQAQDLISNLKESEIAAIKTALAKYEAVKLKERFEGTLAATQWRTRFGRLSGIPGARLGNVDPTGSYCAFPDDWLKKKAVEKAKEPSRQDLIKIFIVNAVPFVAFGFLDNFVMIVAGDYIEQVFGYFMCISTMAAAGLGNTLSDILGIGSAYYVERGCEIIGLKPPDLTPVQFELKSSRRWANYGRIIGITIGCLLGMSPLLFTTDKKSTTAEKEEKNEEAMALKTE